MKFNQDCQAEAEKLDSSENLPGRPELGRSISDTIKKFAPGSELNLKWGKVKVPKVPPPEANATLTEDNFEGEITRKGHGLQRALIITLLQHLALSIHQGNKFDNKEDENNEDAHVERIKQIVEPDLIIAIEETDLYLHLYRALSLSSLLF